MTEVRSPDQPATTGTPSPPAAAPAPSHSWRSVLASTELDTRLLGMVIALVVIWVAFNIRSGGDFLTARNLWNLSVQSTSIAVMATGMVLIIVSRNIDLSVGSLLGFLGYTMALVQTDGTIAFFGLDVTIGGMRNSSYAWLVALAVGVVLGALLGGVTGFIVAYGGVPSFIVTLGGFLIWRGAIFRTGGKQGQTLSPMDETFQLIGGGAKGTLGEWRSWLLAILGCAGVLLSIYLLRRRRQRYDLAVRPTWVDVGSAPSAARPWWPAWP